MQWRSKVWTGSCARMPKGPFIPYSGFVWAQWRRLQLMGHGGTCPPPLLQMAGYGGSVSRKTANKKLTELSWPSRKLSPKRLIVLLEPKNFFPALRSGPVPPLSNSFRRHCLAPIAMGPRATHALHIFLLRLWKRESQTWKVNSVRVLWVEPFIPGSL